MEHEIAEPERRAGALADDGAGRPTPGRAPGRALRHRDRGGSPPRLRGDQRAAGGGRFALAGYSIAK